MYRIQTDGNLKASQVLKNIKDNRLDLYLNALLDIDFLYAKEIKLLGGYNISIIQKNVESDDIIDYFIDTFKRGNDKKMVGKFIFKNYQKSRKVRGGRDVSSVTFFYKYNLFEKR